MKTIRNTTEAEMILEFLKGEMNSERFNTHLNNVLKELHLNSDIIYNGNIHNTQENLQRLEIMQLYRGYPDRDLFNNFPIIDEWKYVELSPSDIKHVYYVNYDYWNELSNHTSSPLEAAKNIEKGIEIFDVSNEPIIKGVEYLKKNTFPPVILITCNEDKYLIIEGHSRMTIYAFNPKKLKGTYAYVGYCSKKEMEKYDSRMINNNDLLSNLDKIHITELGIERIKKNINIKDDVVNYIKNIIKDKKCIISKKGKNYYCEIDNIIVTINSSNYCIITAHITK